MNPLAGRAVAAATACGGLSRLLTSLAAPLPWLFLSRSYRAATAASAATAQPQFDYDSCYYECRGERQVRRDRRIPAPELDSEGAIPVRGVHWAFIGEPNTRKHVYADMLSKLLKVPHISIASLVRQELSPRSFLYKEIANAINCGKLVPESIIFGFLSKRLENGHHRGETGFILDGIPRTRLQAEILDQLADINLVVNFKCSKGLKLSSEEAESNMSKFYKQQIELLEEYYRNQNKLIDFQVEPESAPRETWKGLLSVLRLQHLNAARSLHALDTGTGFRKP